MQESRNTTAWLYCVFFAEFLTARDEAILCGADGDCARVAELVEEYRIEQGLPEAEWENVSKAAVI